MTQRSAEGVRVAVGPILFLLTAPLPLALRAGAGCDETNDNIMARGGITDKALDMYMRMHMPHAHVYVVYGVSGRATGPPLRDSSTACAS